LRGIAVLLVFAGHVVAHFGDPAFWVLEPSAWGTLGVVLFFVHSGCVNMQSIHRHVEKYGTHRLTAAFVTRRALRIYPLSCVVVGVVYFFRLPVSGGMHWLAGTGRGELLASLMLVQNWRRHGELLGTLWSLPYEMQLYCLFPAIYLINRRRPLRLAWLAVVLIAIAVSLRSAPIPNMAFYLLLFTPGFLAYQARHRPTLPAWTLFALLAFCCAAWAKCWHQPYWPIIAGLVGVSLPWLKECENATINGVAGWVSKYSYGIYLLHYPAIWFSFDYIRAPRAFQACTLLVITFGGAVVAYRMIEEPMLRAGTRLAGRIVAS
jgi:peptidoglycan/LPS O-acetylase OafA/YrhL